MHILFNLCFYIFVSALLTVQSGAESATANMGNLEYDTDRPGLDYRSFDLSTPDPNLCRQACKDDPRCLAFTYVKPGYQGPTARCWLKDRVPSATTNKCCISGLKVQGKREINDLKHEVVSKKKQEKNPALCSEARKKIILQKIDDYNTKWANKWCKPYTWSGCGIVPLNEANGLRASIHAARTSEQCDWVLRMASCKDYCVSNYIGDGGAKQLGDCLKNCADSNPWPK